MAPAPLRLQLLLAQGAAVLRRRGEIGREAEVLEELSLEDVPAPVAPGLPELGRQGFEPAHIVRISLHQRVVVGDEGLDEAVLVGVLARAEAPVDEEALDPAVPLAAGIAGEVHALGEVVDAAHAGAQALHLLLGLLGRLVDEQHVHLAALKAQGVALVFQIAEEDAAPVGEGDGLLSLVVDGDAFLLRPVAAEHPAQGQDMVFAQLRVGPAHDHHLDARVAQAQQHGLDAHGPALAAAARPAVADVAVFVAQKLLLFFTRLRQPQLRHTLSPSPAPPKGELSPPAPPSG